MSSFDTHTRKVRQVTLAGMLVNLLLSAMKFAVGIIGSSQAMVADAIHSLSDVTTDLAILFGVKYWTAPADEDHPYGHRRIETMISAFIGVLVAVVALGIGYSALTSLHDKAIARPGWIAFAGAAVSIVLKEAVYRWTLAAGRRIRSSALIANAWHHRSDALSSIPVALAVVVAVIVPEWSFVDRVGALVVSVFILAAAWRITHSALAELADAGAPEEVRDRIREIARRQAGVMDVHKIRTRRMGAGVHVDLHIEVDAGMSVRAGHDISTAVKNMLIEQGPDVLDVVVHLEPHEEG